MIWASGRRLALLGTVVLLLMVAGGLVLELRSPGLGFAGWLVLGGLALAAGASFVLLLPRVDRNVESLRVAADAMAAGDLTARVPVESHDEIASLARALNAAAAQFERRTVALRRERDAGEAVIANLPQGVALLAPDLTIRHANERFWSIVGVPEPARAPRFAAARQPVLDQLIDAALRAGERVTREVSLYVEGRTDYEATVAPVRGESGPAAWLLTLEDLRPEREMANLRREFVANASHELKTPLTSIRGYAETLLQGGLEDEGNRARFVETIRAQAERLEALVDDLLQLADLERPDAVLDRKDWDVSAIARDVVNGFEDLARRRGLALTLEARPELRARLDRKRVELALGNLLENAIKYTDAGTVTVRVEPSPRGVRVSVTDTGRGIDPEHLPRVFERFYRVDRDRSRVAGGTGLGLSIVKHAIQLHGGGVGAESRPGEGSVFWFEIPNGAARS